MPVPLEQVPQALQPRAASKSAVSRRFVHLSPEQLVQWLSRPIGELDLPVVMIDGIHFRDRVILLALGKAFTQTFGGLATMQRCQEHYADLSVMPTWCSRPSVHVA